MAIKIFFSWAYSVMKPAVTISTVLVAAVALVACRTTYQRRDPTGERFPTVTGTALDDAQLTIPQDLSGRKVLLFVGYKMETQFDIDRWLLGLYEAKIAVEVYELPTISGLIPGLFSGSIDDGMRSGIPSEDWAIVVTIYRDARTVEQFLGNENPLPARVVLLDESGDVLFFHDRGYSLASLLRLNETLDKAFKDDNEAPPARD